MRVGIWLLAGLMLVTGPASAQAPQRPAREAPQRREREKPDEKPREKPADPPPRREREKPSEEPKSCCRVCSKGKACGNSCISRRFECHKPKGCACDADGS